jgi:hypothetical protein
MTDETAATPLQKLENRVAALEGTVAMLQAQLAQLARQQPSNGLDPRWTHIGPNVSNIYGLGR